MAVRSSSHIVEFLLHAPSRGRRETRGTTWGTLYGIPAERAEPESSERVSWRGSYPGEGSWERVELFPDGEALLFSLSGCVAGEREDPAPAMESARLSEAQDPGLREECPGFEMERRAGAAIPS